ncbi:MAG: cation diffusion facilitator family transporter [Verrucomicrobia bacterium]|nr:cation diffusion facilitator family transporter [Verrucomicrobiota bacterium]
MSPLATDFPVEQAGSYQRAARAARVGLAANLLLSVVKLVGGIGGHSTALIADAFESMTDVFTSSGLAWSLSRASKPADPEHPYGHGKIENIASNVIASVLMVVAVGIGVGAWQRIRHAETLEGPTGLALVLALFSIVVKEGMFQYKLHVGRKLNSSSLIAEAWHHRSDAFASLAATIGIGGAIAGGPSWRVLDPIAAFVVAIIIAVMGVTIFRRSSLELMDTQVPADTLEKIRQAAAQPGVLHVEKVFARKSGLNILVDVHLEVDDNMTVLASHRLGHEVEQQVMRAVPQVIQVLVHIEPHHRAEREGRRPIAAPH